MNFLQRIKRWVPGAGGGLWEVAVDTLDEAARRCSIQIGNKWYTASSYVVRLSAEDYAELELLGLLDQMKDELESQLARDLQQQGRLLPRGVDRPEVELVKANGVPQGSVEVETSGTSKAAAPTGKGAPPTSHGAPSAAAIPQKTVLRSIKPVAWLVVEGGELGLPRRAHGLSHFPAVIGRPSPDGERLAVEVPDPECHVGRKQATVKRLGGGFMLVHHGLNFTQLDGVDLEAERPYPIADGVRINMADRVVFRFTTTDPSAGGP